MVDLDFDVVELGPADHPEVGERAPDFTRPLVNDEYWEDVSLSEICAERPDRRVRVGRRGVARIPRLRRRRSPAVSDPIEFDAADDLDSAAEAIRAGKLVVYPTETVYGLAADATDPDAVERVFEAKGRARDEPVSLAVPNVESALEYTDPTDREERFMREFLPGPVTVVVERRESVPDALTGGQSRVGVRVPDHLVALALLESVAPLTATSANVSGNPSATTADELDAIADTAAVVLDGGETGGTGSTVVDVEAGTIHRRGANADAIAAWLDDN